MPPATNARRLEPTAVDLWQSNDGASQAIAAFAALCTHGTRKRGADRSDIVSHFHSVSRPSISLVEYAKHIDKVAKFGDDGVFIALILIGRACATDAPYPMFPSELTAHRLLLTALRVATKVHHDVYRSNRTFARAGGISLDEMNALESLFLDRIDFRTHIVAEDLERVKLRAAATRTCAGRPEAEAHHMAVALNIPWSFPETTQALSTTGSTSLRASVRGQQRRGASPQSPSSTVGAGLVAARALRPRSVSPQLRSLCGSVSDVSLSTTLVTAELAPIHLSSETNALDVRGVSAPPLALCEDPSYGCLSAGSINV